MRPKGKLFALLAVFAAIGLVTASGAFTTVQADRTATVNVAGDSSALLALTPATEANGQYAYLNNGQLELDISSSNPNSGGSNFTGAGVNDDALTSISAVFTIENQGTQDVDVYLGDASGNAITLNGNDTALQYYWGSTTTNSSETSTNAVTLSPGQSVSVGFQIDLRVESVSGTFPDFTVFAEASN